ncbi:MAG: LysM peptidoglycan-binding domain-containing protein [Bacteroidales bacterium]|nr:LysM peptidoglycan-binding domain-containing protein [Bacteroidales bacterium]
MRTSINFFIIFNLEMRRYYFFFLFFFFFLMTFAQEKDSINPENTNVAYFFERMVNEKFFFPSRQPSNSMTEIIPYNDSIIIERIKYLNLHSPFEYKYGEDVRKWIDFYLSKPYFISRLLGLSLLYYPLFEETFDKYGIPLELKHLAIVESALNPVAKSRAGAAGLWQFMYKTGILYDLNVTSYVDERFDPIKATDAAARHLKDLYTIYQDWALVLAAYNAGPASINRAILKAGGETNYWKIKHLLPRETRQYVPAFIAASYVMTYYREHGITPLQPKYTDQNIDTITIREKVTFSLLSYFLGVDEEDLTFLNPQYVKGVIPGSSYVPLIVRIPRQASLLFVEKEAKLYDSINKLKLNDTDLVENLKPFEKDLSSSIPTGKKRTHTVSKGETLSMIATKYRVTTSQIKSWNNLTSNYIYPGQKLIIYSNYEPTTTYVSQNQPSIKISTGKITYHTVQKGETLWKISQLYGVSVADIKKVNNLSSDQLQVGQKLKIVKP